MTYKIFSLTVHLLVLFLIPSALYAQRELGYPALTKDTAYTDYFNTRIYDPFRFLEQNTDEQTIKWIARQERIKNKCRGDFPNLNKVEQQLKNLLAIDQQIIPSKFEGVEEIKYEFKRIRNNYSEFLDFYYKETKLGTPYKLLLAAKPLKRNDQDKVEFTYYSISPDNNYLVIYVMHSGSDWGEYILVDMIKKRRLPEKILNVRDHRIIWSTNGFYYVTFDKPSNELEPRRGERIVYHIPTTKQEDDKTIYKNQDESGQRDFNIQKFGDAIILKHPLKLNNVWYEALSRLTLKGNLIFVDNFLALLEQKNKKIEIEARFGDTLILRSNLKSTLYDAFICNMKQKNKLVLLVPSVGRVLVNIEKLTNDRVACYYVRNGASSVSIVNLQGKVFNSLNFEQGLQITNIEYHSNDTSRLFYYVQSFYHPPFQFQVKSGDSISVRCSHEPLPYKPEEFETRYELVKSKDGVEIPVYLTLRKNTKCDGSNPMLLYCYGGYGLSIDPAFSNDLFLWILNGGILAVPVIRGGGGEGSEWADAGRGLNKQNAIDDVITVTNYLINKKYTSPAKLALKGQSHGGFIVAAAMIQQPHLFKAVIPIAAPLDLIRFNNFTIGNALLNRREFGSSTDSLSFNNLLRLSPLHNLKKNVIYPATLIITGENDDRVPPLHSYKFVAALQDNSKDNPYILHSMKGEGHALFISRDNYIFTTLLQYGFLAKEIGLEIRNKD